MITINAIDGSTGTAVLLKTLDASVVEPQFAQLVANPLLSTNAFGTVTAWNAKAAAGNILAFHATNANAAARYLQIHNLAAAPATGAVPLYSFLLPAGTSMNPGSTERSESFFGAGGVVLGTGVSFAVSTTLGTYTAASAADHIVHAHYL